MSTVEETSPRRTLLRAAVRVPEHVVYRSFAQETVALNLQTGQYHGLNQTAGRMLEELEGAETVGAAATPLVDEYGRDRSEVERDLCTLCDQLAARGLIELELPAGT